MSVWRGRSSRSLSPGRRPQVEIVIPVRDEERDLGPGIRRLAAYLSQRFPFRAVVTIADNGSADGTWAAAQVLAGELDGVRTVRLAHAGRPRPAHHLVGERSRGACRTGTTLIPPRP